MAASGSRRQCSIAELLLKYATEELTRFAKAKQQCQQGAIRILRELFGESPVEDFGPLKLRIVRSAMITKGWSVGFINRQVKRVRLMFKRAVGF